MLTVCIIAIFRIVLYQRQFPAAQETVIRSAANATSRLHIMFELKPGNIEIFRDFIEHRCDLGIFGPT